MDEASNKYWTLGIYLALALSTFAVFWQLRNCEFVNYDDPDYVGENQHVQAGITRESIIWAFTTPHLTNWQPLTWLSHMLDCELFGLDPSWHHLTSLLFHIANALLLFWVLRNMTGALWPSAFVAALFALHPLHVESVAWIAERKDVLSTLFWLLTMGAYLRYVKHPGASWYLLALLAFALGLMAKPMLVTLPFVLLLLDYWPLERVQLGHTAKDANKRNHESANTCSRWRGFYQLVWEKAPFFVLSALSSIVTFFAERSGGAVVTIQSFPLIIRIANTFISYVKYIGKMIWPSRLAVFYPHPADKISTWQAMAAVLVLLAISIWVIRLSRSRKYLPVGWFWFIGTLVPVIGLVQIGAQAMADRYTYVPLIGLFIIIAWALPDLLAKWQYRKFALGASMLIILSALSICTCLQLRYWRNSVTLFERAINVTSGNYIMHNNLGVVFNSRNEIDKAVEHCAEAVRIKPDYAHGHNSLGAALFRKGKLDEAIEHFTEAIRIKPGLANAHSDLGGVLAMQGKLDEAITHFTEAVRIKPDYAPGHNNLGTALLQRGRVDEAITHFTRAVQLSPNYPNAHNNLGRALARQGKFDGAIAHFTHALRIKPDFTDAHNNLGAALIQQGKYDKAVMHLAEVVRLAPNSALAHLNLAQVLESEGRIDEAITHYREALRLKPGWVSLINNLAWLLATHKQTEFRNPEEAVRLAERACELTNYEEPGVLDTLAAAYATAARFPEAVATAEKALGLAQSSGQNQLKEEIQNHLRLYKAGQPYIEPSPEVFSD